MYQGCGGATDRDSLQRLEATGQWVAEPKFDGHWAMATGTRLTSRTGRRKPVACPRLPDGTTLVGELAYGTQASVGRGGMDVFDILEHNGRSVRHLPRAGRQVALDALYRDTPILASFYRRAPVWATGFVAAYDAQPEGIVLKPLNDGPYTGGKVERWMKVKRQHTADYVVMGYQLSEAAGKAGLARCIECGGFVDGKLVKLVNVGSMPHSVARSVIADWDSWYGTVVEVGHYGLFKSGSCRHPFYLRRRPDKLAVDCRF